MSDPCKRCGDPDGSHEASEEGTAGERNCALYRIGTELSKLNDHLEGIGRILHALVYIDGDGRLRPKVR